MEKRPTLEGYWPTPKDFDYSGTEIELDSESQTKVYVQKILAGESGGWLFKSNANNLRIKGRKIHNKGVIEHPLLCDPLLVDSLYKLHFSDAYSIYESFPSKYHIEHIESEGAFKRYIIRSGTQDKPGKFFMLLEDNGEKSELSIKYDQTVSKLELLCALAQNPQGIELELNRYIDGVLDPEKIFFPVVEPQPSLIQGEERSILLYKNNKPKPRQYPEEQIIKCNLEDRVTDLITDGEKFGKIIGWHPLK